MISPVKIFTAALTRQADAYTIKYEPITSLNLMERAAEACTQWIAMRYPKQALIHIVCGTGNNGGDGLAMARQLINKGYQVDVSVITSGSKGSQDFQENLKRLDETKINVQHIQSPELFLANRKPDVIVDALFGTGLNKPITGLPARCIEKLNTLACEVVSIDLPSGLFADVHTPKDAVVVKANYTLTFQMPKLAFMFPENAARVGEWLVLDIQLHQSFINAQEVNEFYLTPDYIKQLIKPRAKFSHKGTYGHGLLVAGSFGKMGAAVIAAKGFLHSGAGLLTVVVPQCGYNIIQTAVPEAMAITGGEDFIAPFEFDAANYKAIAIGPGLDTREETKQALQAVLQISGKPMVIDADALNILALHPELLKQIPPGSILTPHPKEFERLAGEAQNDFERHKLQLQFSLQHNVIVVLKGAHTCITTPAGLSYFNSTGNTGLAKGGSGDLLTGIIAGILAQDYTPDEAAITGVFVHGLAADITKDVYGERAMLPSDITELISKAWLQLS